MLCGLFSLWQPEGVQPTPPAPSPPAIVEQYRAGTSPVLLPAHKITYTNYPPGYEIVTNVEQQNADDLEVVKVLTEFLDRNG